MTTMIKVWISFISLMSVVPFTSGKNLLVLNALDSGGLTGVLGFLDTLESVAPKSDLLVKLFLHKSDLQSASMEVQQRVRQNFNASTFSRPPLVNRNIGRPNPPVEMVTPILHSLMQTLDGSGSENVALIISFSKSAHVLPSVNFLSLFSRLKGATTQKGTQHSPQQTQHDILLLGKTRKLSSVSDWHDLMLIGLAITPAAQSWAKTFRDVYLHHADREAYTLLDPRPALLEAGHKHAGKAQIGYLGKGDVCTMRLRAKRECSAVVKVLCGDSGEAHADHPCMVVDKSSNWIHSLSRDMPNTYADFIVKNNDNFKQNVMEAMWRGIIMFRNATGNKPRDFCWDTGDLSSERHAASHIYRSLNDHSPYQHNPDQWKGKLSAVFLTASSGSAPKLTEKLYYSLSKQYYAKRHGYTFMYSLSEQFVQYFHRDLWKASKSPVVMGSDYFRGLMTKTLMLMDAMFAHPDKEWIVWTDDDVVINTGWLYLPMDAFLEDVPKDKLFVQANFHSAFTNVYCIRNNEAARVLVRDWLSIGMSGFVECHAYDQAALQILILQRAAGMMTERPLNHTCLYSAEEDLGCGYRGTGGCDFRFEQSLWNSGFRTKLNVHLFELKLSSFTKGCVNDLIPDFHIITETERRPRLQCGHCSRQWEIMSSGHWNAFLGGGNDAVRRGAVNGWFFNHKSEFLFWESYSDPKNCKRLPDVAETCDEEKQSYFVKHYGADKGRMAKLLSLADGYALDVDHSTFCRVTNPDFLSIQQSKTFMKDYFEVIKLVNKMSDAEWTKSYRSYSGGMGRDSCGDPTVNCKDTGGQSKEGVDGLKNREVNEDFMFDDADICTSLCRENEMTLPGGKKLKAKDCRTPETIARDLIMDAEYTKRKKEAQEKQA